MGDEIFLNRYYSQDFYYYIRSRGELEGCQEISGQCVVADGDYKVFDATRPLRAASSPPTASPLRARLVAGSITEGAAVLGSGPIDRVELQSAVRFPLVAAVTWGRNERRVLADRP
jgi:hypothetical protein